MWSIVGVTLTSLVISALSIPSIIRVAELKNLFDEPDERKKHRSKVPTLGGIAIFAAFIISSSLWLKPQGIHQFQYIISSLMLLFFIGVKDDVYGVLHVKKLIVQIMAALILIHFADIRLTSMYGIFGIYKIPIIPSYLLSLIVIVGITNSINFIDGVDALASSLGILISFTFGLYFILLGLGQWSILCFSLLGSLVGFLIYNRNPAKIFMGDTGALILGMMCATFSIIFIETNLTQSHFKSAPTIAIAVMIIPIFDTIRVVLKRLSKGRSPFRSDRNHIHHLLLRKKFTPSRVSLTLVMLNILTIFFAHLGQDIGEFFYRPNSSAEILLIIILLGYTLGVIFLSTKRGVEDE